MSNDEGVFDSAAKIVGSGIKGGIQGGMVSGAGAVLSGKALVTTPVTLGIPFIEIVVGASTAVAWSTVGAFVLVGAGVGFGGAALVSYLQDKRARDEFDDLCR